MVCILSTGSFQPASLSLPIPASPLGPLSLVSHLLPVVHVSPLAPASHLLPVLPVSPFSPLRPASCSGVKSENSKVFPVSPLAPVSPFRPVTPTLPVSPLAPVSPLTLVSPFNSLNEMVAEPSLVVITISPVEWSTLTIGEKPL